LNLRRNKKARILRRQTIARIPLICSSARRKKPTKVMQLNSIKTGDYPD